MLNVEYGTRIASQGFDGCEFISYKEQTEDNPCGYKHSFSIHQRVYCYYPELVAANVFL